MTATQLPSPIRQGLDEVLQATEALIDAARAEDAWAVHVALRRRTESIERLEPSVARFRAELGRSGERQLRIDGARIAERAAVAGASLDRMRQQAREELARLAQGGAAARSYGDDPSSTRVLDRSG